MATGTDKRFYPAAILSAFALTAFCATFATNPELADLSRVAFGAVLLLFGAWFLRVFVLCSMDPDDPDVTASVSNMFAFAYTFALIAFAILMLPFAGLTDENTFPESGPIRLLRGCVVSPAPAASGLPTAVPTCSTGNAVPHTLLVTLGGVVATKDCLSSEACSVAAVEAPKEAASAVKNGASAPAVTAGASKDAASAGRGAAHKSASGATARIASSGGNAMRVYQVSGGFVLPLYVVMLAFIGGAVSLTRRIPEYQKRTEKHYTSTEKEPKLQPYEAREFVVFQILQLVSAPFIAMVAHYTVAPASVGSAAVLAFASGFASEPILQMIRSAAERLRPQQVQTQEAAQKAKDRVGS